jgi:hypothetical protein
MFSLTAGAIFPALVAATFPRYIQGLVYQFYFFGSTIVG